MYKLFQQVRIQQMVFNVRKKFTDLFFLKKKVYFGMISNENLTKSKSICYIIIFFLLCFVVLAIKNGREISRFTGAADENRIQKMIDQLSR